MCSPPRPGAHPRSRGADLLTPPGERVSLGSSPLARGGLVVDARLPADRGLIPARAGRTPHPYQGHSQTWAHPCSRGADVEVAAHVLLEEGSSPLARGGRRGRRACAARGGLIPARAGRTQTMSRFCFQIRAHPRSRGADGRQGPLDLGLQGSSPLARGGRPDEPQRSPQRGLGPPLARGGRPDEPQRSPQRGLIPARAGRTWIPVLREHFCRAHPRSRGADPRAPRMRSRPRGSSPLARGGLSQRRIGGGLGGLIPARAGRTPHRPRGTGLPGAHPRSRGADYPACS